MNKFFLTFVFVLALLFVADGKSKYHKVSHIKAPPSHVVQFLEGFAEGIETTIGNVTECTKDLDITFDDFNISFVHLRYGFDHLNVKEIELGCVYLGKGLEEVSVALHACGLEELAKEIKDLATELSTGVSGIIEVIVKEAVNVFYHRHDLTADFHSAINNWEKGDFFNSGIAVGKIVGILLKD